MHSCAHTQAYTSDIIKLSFGKNKMGDPQVMVHSNFEIVLVDTIILPALKIRGDY